MSPSSRDSAFPHATSTAPLLLLITVLAWPAPVQAWSAEGHRIIAQLAEKQIEPHTRRQIDRLLRDEANPSLAGVAAWADEVRDNEAYRSTGRYHFLNFPRGDCRFAAARDCPGGNCVVGAIRRYARELADTSGTRRSRTEALKFLVHFVGDVHQPLHAGYADDRGGNDFQTSFNGKGSNLHAVWDRLLLQTRKLKWREYAHVLGQAGADETEPAGATTGPRRDPADPVGWAEESCRMIEDESIYPDRRVLDEAYFDRVRPLAEARIQLAAARLALLLDEIFAR